MAVNETKVTKIFVGSTAPTVNKNLIWCDTSKNYQLKKFIGTSDGVDQWKVLAASEASAITIEENGQKYILQDYVLALATELDNKANASDLASYLPLTGGTIARYEENSNNPILTIQDTQYGFGTPMAGLLVKGGKDNGQDYVYYSTYICPDYITGDAVTSSITSGSHKLLTSGGAYTALQSKANASDLDNYLPLTGGGELNVGSEDLIINIFSEGSPAPIQIVNSSTTWGAYTAPALSISGTCLANGIEEDAVSATTEISGNLISGDAVTDSVTASSKKLLTSGGAYTALQNKQDKLSFITEDTSNGELYLGDTTDSSFSWIRVGQYSQEVEIYSYKVIVGNFNGGGSELIINTDNISGSAISSKISNSSTTIPSTSAVYSALQSKADNTNVVHLSGDEVITGNKLFTSSIRFSTDSTSLTAYDPGTPPVLIIDSNSNITIDASNVIDPAYYNSYGIISGSDSTGETFRIDGQTGSASFSSLYNIGSISGSAIVSTIGTSTTSSKLPTEGAVVAAVNAINTSLANKQDKLQYYTETIFGNGVTTSATIGSDHVRIGTNPYIEIVGREPEGIYEITIDAETLSIDADNITGNSIARTLGTTVAARSSTKLPTEGAVVKAISDVKTSLGSALTYEGSVENYSNLPTGLTTSDKGKVYNVVNANDNIPAGTNYAWNGKSWDALGGDLSAYQLKTDQSLTTTSKQIVGAINELNLKIDITTGPAPITSVYTVDSTVLEAFITDTQYANIQGKITISPSIDNVGAVYFGQSITDKAQAFPLYPGQIMSFSFTDINTFMCASDISGDKFNYVVEFGVVNKDSIMDAGMIIRSATGENYRLIPVTDETGAPTLELERLV